MFSTASLSNNLPRKLKCRFLMVLNSSLCLHISSKSLSLVLLSVQITLNILLQQVISNTFSRFTISLLIIHVSQPYNNVDHMHFFINLILSVILMCLQQIRLLILLNELPAIPILCLISFSHLPSFVNMLPRYLKLFTCWSGSFPTGMLQSSALSLDMNYVLYVTRASVAGAGTPSVKTQSYKKIIHSVLLKLIFSSTSSSAASTPLIILWSFSSDSAISIISSIYLILQTFFSVSDAFHVTYLPIIISANSETSTDDRIQPWLTPFLKLTQSDISFSTRKDAVCS